MVADGKPTTLGIVIFFIILIYAVYKLGSNSVSERATAFLRRFENIFKGHEKASNTAIRIVVFTGVPVLVMLCITSISSGSSGLDRFVRTHWISFSMGTAALLSLVGMFSQMGRSMSQNMNSSIPDYARTYTEVDAQNKTNDAYVGMMVISGFLALLTFILEFFDWFHTLVPQVIAILVLVILLLWGFASIQQLYSARGTKYIRKN